MAERKPYKGRAGYGRTTALGYGNAHQQARKRWKIKVDAGQVHCGRCGKIIDPETAWDLAHPGDDSSATPEPWHERCNAQYANVTKARRRAASPQPKKKRPPGWRNPRTGQVWSEDWTGDGIWSDE